MASRRPARRRPSHAVYRAAGLRWTCGVILLVGVALVAVGALGLLHTPGRIAVALGSATSIVFGAVLIVFAALLPWLADGPVRIGPLAVTLRIRGRRRPRGRRR